LRDSLFEEPIVETSRPRPLADRLRPAALDEIIGQSHLFGEGAPLALDRLKEHLPSMILWGPPGCGKTTIARILAGQLGLHLEAVSPITSGAADLKKIFDAAKLRKGRTLLFVDEIHRFNRAQQDLFLPYVENGTVILVGATTENPSFALNGALLSRCKVVVLERLTHADLLKVVARAEENLGKPLPLTPEARETLVAMADGDARYLLNMCEELASLHPKKPLTVEGLSKALQKRAILYDKNQEEHYNLISALHKSLRGSDVQAALYWFQRMLSGGEDLHYILRRLTRFASEDIGLADPQALPHTLAAWDAYDRLGSPEGDLMISQAVIYLATAPKSNAAYVAHGAAKRDAKTYGSLMPPKHILNAPTKLMESLDYGKGYAYDHDTAEGFSGQNYFPDEMGRHAYYSPAERGFEREIKKRLDYWEKLRQKTKS
jgi:putative ATPase